MSSQSDKEKDRINKDKIDRLQLDKFNLNKKLKEEMTSREAMEKRLTILEADFAKQKKRLNLVEKPADTMPYKTKGKVIPTFWCYFLIGSNRGYDTTTLITQEELLKHIANFQSKYWKESCSVNVAPNNTIVFQDYKEMCYKVEAINYPRFPKTERDIYEFMLTLMEYLMVNLDQQRITLVTPNKSVMLENTQLIDELAIKAEKKTVLYLHGFRGEPNPNFNRLMEKSDLNVIAPKMNYETTEMYNKLSDTIKNQKVKMIIGHSLGGYMAYYLSQEFKLPVFLLAPAFGENQKSLHELQAIPKIALETEPLPNKKLTVIGLKDEDLSVGEVVEFLKDKSKIVEIPNMGHDIPTEIFKEYLEKFLKNQY